MDGHMHKRTNTAMILATFSGIFLGFGLAEGGWVSIAVGFVVFVTLGYAAHKHAPSAEEVALQWQEHKHFTQDGEGE